MKDYCKILLIIFLEIGLIVHAENLETEIANQLSSLTQAETLEQVDTVIQETRDYLRANRGGTNEVTWGFLEADIIQTHGRMYANFRVAGKASEKDAALGRQLLIDSIRRYKQLAELADDKADLIEESLHSSAKRSNRWLHLAGSPSRANYSQGWSFYSLGLLGDTMKSRNENFSRSMEFFLPFIGDGYRDNRIIQDCFLGGGLCLFEMGRLADARDLINENQITFTNTPPDVFKQITLLRIRIHEKMKSFLNIELAGRYYFQNRPSKTDNYDPIELEIVFKRMEALAHLSRPSRDNLYASAYLEQLYAFRREINRCDPQWNMKISRILKDAGIETALGYLQMAKDCYDRGDYKEAITHISAGSKLADKSFESEITSDLEYLKCLSCNQLGRYREAFTAAKLFLEDYKNDSRSKVISQIAMESAVNLAKAHETITLDEFDSCAAIYAENYPDIDGQEMLRWYRAGFYAAKGQFEKAGNLLEDIHVGMWAYRRNLYLKCFVAYQQSRLAESTPGILQTAVEAIIEFSRLPVDETGEDWICESMFDLALAVMGELAQSDNPAPEPTGLIDAVESFDCADNNRQQRLLSMKVRFFAKFNRLQELRDILQQARKQPDDSMLSEALFVAANSLTTQSSSTESVESVTEKASLAAELFRFVLETCDKSENDTRRDQILWMLAENLRQCGQYEQAIKEYDKILKADSPHVQIRVMRSLAVSYQAMNQYQEAAKYWRHVTRMTVNGKSGWYEANFQLIKCHYLAGDTEKARQLLDYFYLKHPAPLPPEWSMKFDELRGRVKS